MGLFGPSRAEKLAAERIQKFATDPIPAPTPNPYMKHVKGRIPDYMDVVAAAIAESGQPPSAVNMPLVFQRVVEIGISQFNSYKQQGSRLVWPEVEAVLLRPDFTTQMLTNYLFGLGNAPGIAVHNAFAELMTDRVPSALAEAIRDGKFPA